MESVWITVCLITALPLAFVAVPALVNLVGRVRPGRAEQQLTRPAVSPRSRA